MRFLPWLLQLSQSTCGWNQARRHSAARRQRRPLCLRLEGLEERVLLAADGDFGFAFTTPSTGTALGNAIATDAAGDVLVAGIFVGKIDVDPGAGVTEFTSLAGEGFPNTFIAKYAPDGSLIWAQALLGSASQAGALTTDSDGNVYVTGLYQGTVDFDPGAATQNRTSNGNLDTFILKLDHDGHFDFVTTMGGPGVDFSLGITVDASQNIYTGGAFQQTVDFDPGAGVQNHTSHGGYDIFVSKLDSSGNYVFAVTVGGPEDDAAAAIALDSTGDIFTTGLFADTVDFSVGLGGLILNQTSLGGTDAFVYKLTNNGVYGGVVTLGGTGDDGGTGIGLGPGDNIYYSGYFVGIVDFDFTPGVSQRTSSGPQSGFVSRLGPDGNLIYASVLGGTAADTAQYLHVDSSGNAYSTGSYSGTIDLDPGVGTQLRTSNGQTDIFVSKLDPNGNYVYGDSLGGSASEFVAGLAVDALGNTYTTGQYSGTPDFDPGPGTSNLDPSPGVSSLFVSKLLGPPIIPAVNLAVSSATATEAGQTQITVTATADSPVSGDQTIDLALSGTGMTLIDYALSDGDAGLPGIQIKILDGQTTGTVTFTVLNDNLVELAETAALTISNPSTGIHLGSTVEQDVTITDDDVAVISISNPSVTEGGTLSFDVTISNPVDVAVTADRTTADGTATTGDSDYTALALANVQLFAAGSTTPLTVTVQTTADGRVELDEALSLILSSRAAGGRNVTFSNSDPSLTGTGTITNDDTAPTLNITPDGVLTSASTITFTFQFSRPMTGFSLADINLTNGTAGLFTEIAADQYTLVVTPVADGTVTVAVAAAQATDASGNPNPAATASVTSDRTGPVFSTSTNINVAENTLAVETAAASDPHGPVTYALEASGDSALFAIGTTSGILTLTTAPDFENPADADHNNIYAVQVRATDALNVSTIQTITVTVTAVNDNAPQFTSGAAFQIAENTMTAGTVLTTDADLPAQTITYSISGGADGSLFSISNTGVLSFTTAPDFENPADAGGNNVYEVEVTAADGQGSTTTQPITVTVTNAGEPPQLTNVSAVTWTKVRPPTAINVLPTVIVAAPGTLAGGSLSITMNTVGSKRKSADILKALSISTIGAGSDFLYANGKLSLQIELGEQATDAKIQSFLRGITFSTKGKGLKTLTRAFQVTLTDAGDLSGSVNQTIHVKKKP